jgi:hypothetical protein
LSKGLRAMFYYFETAFDRLRRTIGIGEKRVISNNISSFNPVLNVSFKCTFHLYSNLD